MGKYETKRFGKTFVSTPAFLDWAKGRVRQKNKNSIFKLLQI